MRPYLESIRADGAAVAAVVRAGPLHALVPSCPGWDLRDLAEHLGHVQRWARQAAVTATSPADTDIELPPRGGRAPEDAAALADWLAAGNDALISALDGRSDDSPTWHPFPVPLVAGVWPRRQAHELAIHRWDAEHAVGPTHPLDPDLAADFVREYFEVVVPRVMDRDARTPPVGDVAILLLDTGDNIVVRSTPSRVELLRGDGAAAHGRIEGAAQDVLLALWRRRALPRAATAGPARDWLEFGGN